MTNKSDVMGIQVSLIICTYNRKGLVVRAIESAFAQDAVNCEVIVVDDCSSDGTFEYIQKQYGDKIKLVSTDQNSGVATATNVGYSHSSGKYIALLGDDDYWEDPRKLAKQLLVMEDNRRIGVSGTWWVELREGGERVEKTLMPPKSRYFLKERMLAGGGVVCGSTPLITRQAWDAVGGMDEKQLKGTDSDLFRRIAFAGYDVNVLNEVTTVVDLSHGAPRMTPLSDKKNIGRSIKGNINVLRKNNVIFFVYPRALFVRVKRLMNCSLKFISPM